MKLHKGDRVQELTKKVGQVPRRGTVRAVTGPSVEVRWDDGHTSSLADGYLFPIREPHKR